MVEVLRDLLDEPAGKSTKRRRVAERLYQTATAKHASVPALRLLVERSDVDDLAAQVAELLERLDRLEAAQAKGPRLVEGSA